MFSKIPTKLFRSNRSRFFSKNSLTELISSNPLEYHTKWQERLLKDGMLASFTEFKDAVDYLQSALQQPDILDLAKKNEHVEQSLFQVNNNLFHLNFNFIIDGQNYPHRPPYKGIYPYLPTVIGIGNALGFLDSCHRTNNANIPPLYHVSRYKYHELSFYQYNERDNPIILFPTTDALALDFFIKTRAVPIGFVGVSGKNAPTVFADAYYNTPLDFWLHDINHNRRYKSYNTLYLQKHACTPDEMYKRFDSFIQQVILPSISITPDLPLQDKYLRQIMCVLYFELLHEYALTPDKESLQEAFLHAPGAPSPFEHMINPHTFNKEEMEEKLRMKNNNINSGFSFFEKEKPNEVTVRYFFDKGPNFLTSAYNKLINGFYDTHYQRDDFLPPFAERTIALAVKAAQQILMDIGSTTTISRDEIAKLLHLVNDKNAFIEKYPNLELKSVKKITSNKTTPSVEDALALFKKHSRVNAEILGITFYPGTTNYVYLIETEQEAYTLKIYNETKSQLIKDEIYGYQKLSGNPMVKSLIAKGDSFFITTYVKGKSLKELLTQNNLTPSNIEAINSQINLFISNLPLKTNEKEFGKGIMTQDVHKNSWQDWLDYFLTKLETKLQTISGTEKAKLEDYFSTLKTLLTERNDYLCNVKPHLIFIDFNLSNFILSKNNKLTFIDLELMASGDLLLAYGEWVSQIYGTDLFDDFKRYLCLLTPEQNSMIRLYALLGNLISLIEEVSNGQPINKAHPRGNPNNPYLKMMDSHIEEINEQSEVHLSQNRF